MKVLVIDNYDSFVYNIAQLLGELKTEPTVLRNDCITLSGIRKMNPDAIVLSPGPGHPADQKVLWCVHGYHYRTWAFRAYTWGLPWTSRDSPCFWWQSYQCWEDKAW